jgi:hypothetical protein
MVTKRFGLNQDSLVTEIASNDGYLLQYFKELSIPCIGIEPTASTAKISIDKGIETWQKFWGEATAKEMIATKGKAKLIIGNNVFAHVPNLHDFVNGLQIGLADDGIITLEFPHLLNLINFNQFDTIYHEHFSYLSLIFCQKIFNKYNMEIFDVEELETHGGSLRIFISHKAKKNHISDNVAKVLKQELDFGLDKMNVYKSFQQKIDDIKIKSLNYLVREKLEGKKIAAYGAAAKGNTFLNFCGIKADMITLVCDAAPSKQNRFLPGSHIPVTSLDQLINSKADTVIILPWNLEKEIVPLLREKMGTTVKIVKFIPILSEQ